MWVAEQDAGRRRRQEDLKAAGYVSTLRLDPRACRSEALRLTKRRRTYGPPHDRKKDLFPSRILHDQPFVDTPAVIQSCDLYVLTVPNLELAA